MKPDQILSLIHDKGIKFVDLRFTDTRGKEQHVTIPEHVVNEDFLSEGKMFDGSSIAGWKSINESDMVLIPDLTTAVIDPFFSDPTLNLRCDVFEPTTMESYSRDPRGVARKAEQFLQSSGIADQAFFGPEPEFFIFDDVRWEDHISGAFYQVDTDEAAWNSGKASEEGNIGHRPGIKGGYFPVPPVDSLQDLRAAICTTLKDMGVETEVHHHEVGTAGQCEIGTRFDTLVRRADANQIFKYVVLNIAHNYGKTATFMPKPLVGDNGSGMHVHQSLFKNGENLFAGDSYNGISDTALFYIGGILKHARAINAFANGSTNSYKRLVPGYEAPVLLTYSARNRSAAIRIPFVHSPKECRAEVRFGDAAANPYFTFAAMLMAGIDGIQNKIHPGDPMDQDLYSLSHEEQKAIPTVCASLNQALESLDTDRDFLKLGNVFTDDTIDGYIELKQGEVDRLRMATHPVEFDMYYSC